MPSWRARRPSRAPWPWWVSQPSSSSAATRKPAGPARSLPASPARVTKASGPTGGTPGPPPPLPPPARPSANAGPARLHATAREPFGERGAEQRVGGVEGGQRRQHLVLGGREHARGPALDR